MIAGNSYFKAQQTALGSTTPNDIAGIKDASVNPYENIFSSRKYAQLEVSSQYN